MAIQYHGIKSTQHFSCLYKYAMKTRDRNETEDYLSLVSKPTETTEPSFIRFCQVINVRHTGVEIYVIFEGTKS